MASIVLGIRFLLEIATVGGLFSGIFIKKGILQRILFAVLTITITLVWARYGAPKSPTVLTGNGKLCLELIVYFLGSLTYFFLFGTKIGTTYLVIASLDLWLMYQLNLQGH